LIRWDNTSRLKTFFSDETTSAIGSYNGYQQVRQSLPEAYGRADSLARAQYLEMSIFLSNYLLSSQGVRLPYLDPRVIEFMGRVPAKWKIMGLNEKHILKKSFRGILPDEITGRSKHPYRAPIKHSLLNDRTAECTREALLRKLETLESPSEIDNMALVGILSSQLVFNRFIEEFPVGGHCSVSPNLLVDRRSETMKSTS
jgi:asparagine synthase (glutamine-hydrolysing)